VTEQFDQARTAGSATPALIIVDADRQARMATEAALVRFEPDYRVVTADSPTTGLAALQGWRTTAWPAQRAPLPFETSVPGAFAASDVRFGSVKRVAGAVGEGSVTVGSVHQYLADATAEIHPPSSQASRPQLAASGREWSGRPHRSDDITDCVADCGGISFV
jgi:hypothetical protein